MPITTAGERSTRMPTAARQGGRQQRQRSAQAQRGSAAARAAALAASALLPPRLRCEGRRCAARPSGPLAPLTNVAGHAQLAERGRQGVHRLGHLAVRERHAAGIVHQAHGVGAGRGHRVKLLMQERALQSRKGGRGGQAGGQAGSYRRRRRRPPPCPTPPLLLHARAPLLLASTPPAPDLAVASTPRLQRLPAGTGGGTRRGTTRWGWPAARPPPPATGSWLRVAAENETAARARSASRQGAAGRGSGLWVVRGGGWLRPSRTRYWALAGAGAPTAASCSLPAASGCAGGRRAVACRPHAGAERRCCSGSEGPGPQRTCNRLQPPLQARTESGGGYPAPGLPRRRVGAGAVLPTASPTVYERPRGWTRGGVRKIACRGCAKSASSGGEGEAQQGQQGRIGAPLPFPPRAPLKAGGRGCEAKRDGAGACDGGWRCRHHRAPLALHQPPQATHPPAGPASPASQAGRARMAPFLSQTGFYPFWAAGWAPGLARGGCDPAPRWRRGRRPALLSVGCGCGAQNPRMPALASLHCMGLAVPRHPRQHQRANRRVRRRLAPLPAGALYPPRQRGAAAGHGNMGSVRQPKLGHADSLRDFGWPIPPGPWAGRRAGYAHGRRPQSCEQEGRRCHAQQQRCGCHLAAASSAGEPAAATLLLANPPSANDLAGDTGGIVGRACVQIYRHGASRKRRLRLVAPPPRAAAAGSCRRPPRCRCWGQTGTGRAAAGTSSWPPPACRTR